MCPLQHRLPGWPLAFHASQLSRPQWLAAPVLASMSGADSPGIFLVVPSTSCPWCRLSRPPPTVTGRSRLESAQAVPASSLCPCCMQPLCSCACLRTGQTIPVVSGGSCLKHLGLRTAIPAVAVQRKLVRRFMGLPGGSARQVRPVASEGYQRKKPRQRQCVPGHVGRKKSSALKGQGV